MESTMDLMMQIGIFFLACLGIGVIVVCVITSYGIYRRNVERLKACADSKIVRPGKVRYVLAFFVYTLISYIPAVLLIWLIEKESSLVFALITLVFLLSFSPASYPYYTLSVSSEKVNGATMWGWLWKRTEIRLDEIDKEKLSSQWLGKKLGIMVIHSTSGTKILTLGLNDGQLLVVTGLAHKPE
jgi:hypothetical protein